MLRAINVNFDYIPLVNIFASKIKTKNNLSYVCIS